MNSNESVTCAADGCRKYANLTRVALHLPEEIRQAGSLKLPDRLTIHLCPKHFKLKREGR